MIDTITYRQFDTFPTNSADGMFSSNILNANQGIQIQASFLTYKSVKLASLKIYNEYAFTLYAFMKSV